MHAASSLLERAAALLARRTTLARLELVPELGLVLTESGAARLAAEEVLSEVIERTERRRREIVGSRRGSSASRSGSAAIPRGGWERRPRARRGRPAGLEARRSRSARTPRARARLVPRRPRPRALGGRVARGEEALRAGATPRTGRGRPLAGGGDRRPARLRRLVGPAPGPRRHRTAASRCSSRRRTTSSSRRAAGAGSAASSRGKAASTRRASSSRRRRRLRGARRESRRRRHRGVRPRATSSWLAGDLAAAESALRDGYEALGNLGELGYRASRRGDARPDAPRAQADATEADDLAAIVEATASEQDLWSQVLYRLTRARPPRRRGRARRGRAAWRGRRSRSSSRPTCSTCTATSLLELGRRAARGRPRRRGARVRRAGDLALRAQGERRLRRAGAGTARARRSTTA